MLAAPSNDIDPIADHGTIGVYAYVDVVGVWHKRPLSQRELCWLASESKPLLKPPFLVRRPARFDPAYVVYTRLRQPSNLCLQWLIKRDVLINYVELARDLIYADDNEPEVVGQLFNSSLVQLWHGDKRHTVIFVDGANGSTGIQAGIGLSFTWYTTKPSKITGEVNCFHLEARLCGSKTIRKHGIIQPSDLLTFDHDKFWREMWAKRLALVEIDRAKLGRYQDNCVNGTKRRTLTYEDYRRGCLLYRIYGQAGEGGFSNQGVFDQFGQFGRASFIKHDSSSTRPELTAPCELAYPLKLRRRQCFS